MLVRIPSVSAHLGPLMPDSEIADDALLGLGNFGQAKIPYDMPTDKTEANLEDLKNSIKGFLTAEAISIGAIIAAEVIAKNTKNESVWRLLHAVIAGTSGYAAFKSFEFSAISGKADRGTGVVAGGTLMTINGLMTLGNALAVFGPVDTSTAGKKYKLVTATQTLKKITPAMIPV